MISRSLTTIGAACAVGLSLGCHHRGAEMPIVSVPSGLDSVGVARWLDQQRAACRGRLIMLLDEGGATRNFGPPAAKSESQYRPGLVGVECRP